MNHHKPSSESEAIRLAVGHCIKLAAELRGSPDPIERARAELIEAVSPGFYIWMSKMQVGNHAPCDCALAFAEEVASMLANLADAASDNPATWCERVAALIARTAISKLERGPFVQIDKEKMS